MEVHGKAQHMGERQHTHISLECIASLLPCRHGPPAPYARHSLSTGQNRIHSTSCSVWGDRDRNARSSIANPAAAAAAASSVAIRQDTAVVWWIGYVQGSSSINAPVGEMSALNR